MGRRNRYTPLFAIWLLLITLLSLVPFKDTGAKSWFDFKHTDKIVHVIFYFGFVVTAAFALRESRPSIALKTIVIWATLAAIFYGVFIEVMQHLLPFGRSADINDFVANTLGAILAALLIVRYRSRIKPLN